MKLNEYTFEDIVNGLLGECYPYGSETYDEERYSNLLNKIDEEFQEALEHFHGNLSRELHFACEGWNACLDEILGETE